MLFSSFIMTVGMSGQLPCALYGQKCFFGIRIPWAFVSEENWERANRPGGLALIVTGLVMPVAALALL
jgi:hypothetical protein